MRKLQITQQITNRDSRSLEKYFDDVGGQERVTAGEEFSWRR